MDDEAVKGLFNETLAPATATINHVLLPFFLMALSYQKLPLSVAEPIWAALGIIAATLLGQFVYHERVALAQWLGVFLIIVGVLLVSFNNSN